MVSLRGCGREASSGAQTRVVVHRPILEMNKQITGSGFISFLALSGLERGNRRGVSFLKSSVTLNQKDLGAGWEILVPILSTNWYLKTLTLDWEFEEEALQPHSFPKISTGSLLCKHLYPYFRNG